MKEDNKAENKNEGDQKSLQHIAIIMDGNGRWAKLRHLPKFAGHKKGADAVRGVVETCAELDVKYLTLYA
ncbi:MAG: di-trans,poly-cis-decaprenylcistransferase, partial [Kordiimonadaceae bacterium]|nr:di-trans,poly-cis-decaprenylcistransferase [Kordiimonadaceae bacterium]